MRRSGWPRGRAAAASSSGRTGRARPCTTARRCCPRRRDGHAVGAGSARARRRCGILTAGHERQRQAPARWPATLPPRWGAPGDDLAGADRRPQARTRRAGPGSWRPAVPSTVLSRPIVPSAADDARRGVHPLLPVVGADTEVPLVRGGRARYVGLDTAASAPALVAVAERVAETLPLYASVHRGAGYLSQVSTALYETARDTVAAFVGARSSDVCVFTRHTTDALNLLAGCVPPDEAVLVLDCEHHADLLPWQRRGPVTVLPTEPTVTATLRSLADALVRGRYALVAVTGASNVTGESLPVD